MKERTILAIAFTVILIGTLFGAFRPTRAFVGQIKIGIIGPVGLPHWSPAGMHEAAEMAAEEINAAGGIHLSDGDYELIIVEGDSNAYPTPDPAAAAAEVERLITVEGCEYIVGGFRTECTTTMIEMAMDYDIPFIINGASTNGLISDTVPVDYERYKWLFRINPINGTALVGSLAGAIQYYIPTQLLPVYGFDWGGPNPQVKVAVLTEDLMWSLEIHYAFTLPNLYPLYLGPYVNVTYAARIPDGETDCTSYLQGVKDSGARVMIHIFSGVTGVPLIAQWKSMNVSALPIGINVMAQLQNHPETTAGACMYETVLNFMGTRTPACPRTVPFWDEFVARSGGAWPMYVAAGAYDGIYTVVEGLEGIGTNNKTELVTFLESYVRTTSVVSNFSKFDSTHDIFCPTYAPVSHGWTRTMVVQWMSPTLMAVVAPVDQSYTRRLNLPLWMYPFAADTNWDGDVDSDDLFALAPAYGSEEGDPLYKLNCDFDSDGDVDSADLFTLAPEYGGQVTLPLP